VQPRKKPLRAESHRFAAKLCTELCTDLSATQRIREYTNDPKTPFPEPNAPHCADLQNQYGVVARRSAGSTPVPLRPAFSLLCALFLARQKLSPGVDCRSRSAGRAAVRMAGRSRNCRAELLCGARQSYVCCSWWHVLSPGRPELGIRFAGGRRAFRCGTRRKTFPTVVGALAWRQETQVALRRGTLRAPTATTLAEAAEAWLAGADAGIIRTPSGDPYKPSALRSYRHALQSKLLPEPVVCASQRSGATTSKISPTGWSQQAVRRAPCETRSCPCVRSTVARSTATSLPVGVENSDSLQFRPDR
jgi:hypothetical protein